MNEPDRETIRLLADAMLGTMARWLRILGYDVLYDPILPDHELVRLARAEGRVLLTRDRELTRRRNLHVLFIRSQRWEDQVCQVLGELPLPRPEPFTRCALCGERLLPLRHSEAWGLVPPYVFVTQREFSLCPECNRVYWRGTHRERMERTVERLARCWRPNMASKPMGSP